MDIRDRKPQYNKFRAAGRVMIALTLLTALAGLIYMVLGIASIISAGPATSFPWHTACFFTALYFGPPLVLEIIIYVVIRYMERRKNGQDR